MNPPDTVLKLIITNFERELITFAGIHLLQWFSASGQFCFPQETFGSLVVFLIVTTGRCYWQVETMGAVNIPRGTGEPTARNHLAQNTRSAGFEKP